MKVNLTPIFFTAVFTFAILSRVIDNIYLLRVAQILGMLGLITNYKYTSHQLKIIGGAIIFVILFLLKIFLYEEVYLTGFFALSVVGSGIVYYNCLLKNKKFYLYYVIFTSFTVILYLIINITVIGIDSNELIRGSRNYITTLCLALSAGIIIGLRRDVKSKIIKLAAYFVILLMSIFIFLYTGRTGVVISMGVTGILLIHMSGARLRVSSVLISSFSIGLLLLIGILLDLHETSTGWNRLQERAAEEDVRILIWTIALQYMLDPSYFMGVPEGFWTQLTGYSSHNSFIFVYSNFGWPGLIFVVFITVYYLIYLLIKDKIIAALLFLIIFRSFFDLTLLTADLGPFFVLCILLADNKQLYNEQFGQVDNRV